MRFVAELTITYRAMRKLILLTFSVINIVLPILTYMSGISRDPSEQMNFFCAVSQTLLPLIVMLPITYLAKFTYDPAFYELLFNLNPGWGFKMMLSWHVVFSVNIALLFFLTDYFIPGVLFLLFKLIAVLFFMLAAVSILMVLTHSFTLTFMVHTLYVLANFLFYRATPTFPMFYEDHLPDGISSVVQTSLPYLVVGVVCLCAAYILNRRFVTRKS